MSSFIKCVCLFVFLGFLPISAVQLDFSTSQASNISGNSVHPSVAANENGQIMTVWWDEARNRIMSRLFTPSNGFGPTVEIPGQGGPPCSWPRIRGGTGNDFHLVWQSGYGEFGNAIQYVLCSNGAFGKVETVNSYDSAWPDICYNAASNTVSVAWEEVAGLPNGEIMLRQRRNGRWGANVNISNTPLWSGHVRICSDDAGHVYAIWQEKTKLAEAAGDSEIYETFYTHNRSGAWPAAIQITNDGAFRLTPNVAARSDGSEVFLEWFNTSDRYYWGLAITYSGNTPNYGQAHRITYGHLDHMFYFTGMAYQNDILYMAYITDYRVWLQSYSQGLWSKPGLVPGSSTPRNVDLSHSANLGLVLCWSDMGKSPVPVFMSYGEVKDAPAPKPNEPPVARLSVSPSQGIYPLTVTLDGRGSSDVDGKITAYAWTLGDGAAAKASSLQHVYAKPGTYSISLIVTDDDKATASASASVTVLGMEPPLNIRSVYRQNRNLFSIEHFYHLSWEANPINEQRGFTISHYNFYRRIKGESAYQYLGSVAADQSYEYLDRSLKNNFLDYEYTVMVVDALGRQSDLPGGTNALAPISREKPERNKSER